MSSFGNYSGYYDLLYKDKEYAKEAEYIHRLVQRFAPGAKTLLNLGCGTGKHDYLLAEKGYAIHGVDLSETMLDEAKRRAPNEQAKVKPEFSQGDIRKIRLDKKFDAVISLFHVMSYQVTNQDLLDSFQTVKHHLKDGGIFIFDCWYGPCVITEKPEMRVKRLEDDKIKVIRVTEPDVYANENRVDVNYQILIFDKQASTSQEIKETHHMRYLFKPEIENLFNGIGMQLLSFEEWLTSKEPGFNTFGVCFVGGSK